MELTQEIREEMESRGWEFFEGYEGVEAEIEIDLTTHDTAADFGFLTSHEYEPDVFIDRVFAVWRVDFRRQTATVQVFEGQRTGSEASDDDDFEGTIEMDVEHVGTFQYERLIGSDNRMRYAWHDLLRVTEDFHCALWRLDAGQHLIRVSSNVNVEGWEPSEYHRISDEQAARILTLDEEDRDLAVSEMERIVEEAQERVR